ncbi:FAD-dependent oxidoreductase [Amycolatopsis sp. CA-230715]|uniref:FAD-dependent oxidoreductase n=1 Tax=Amycolatopsis sp. CA-230715 TaxID=2745196 RepID=UPI001C024EE5|nr:FAD-dependent monooxygenase [Amycolatopsis sp. CA-230715]QWF83567.1 FAD-dependent urate hydroxylase [Amycolatopsis sp. CA-230715]
MRVAVIGAGLGGLALAQGLKRAGIDVRVYERDAALASRMQGYRLHLDGRAMQGLRRLLPPRLAELFDATAYVPSTPFMMLDDRLETVLADEFDGGGDVSIDRLVLRRILISGIEDEVEFGKELTGYRSERGQVTASFRDGTETTADVLVAADGINSTVRRQYLPHARIFDTGVYQLYGRVPLDERTRGLFDDRMFGIFTAIAGPDRTRAGVAPVEFPEDPRQAAARIAGIDLHPVSSYMTCSFSARHDWFEHDFAELRTMPGPDLHALMTRGVRDWHPRIRDIVAHCEPESVFALSLRSSVPIEPWPTTNVTLLGDAIHAMSPAAGAGACAALWDADLLSALLSGGGDPLVALRKYEAEMIEYGFAKVREGASNGQYYIGQDPLPVS